jgi:lysophospholipase L1-like esterase
MVLRMISLQVRGRVSSRLSRRREPTMSPSPAHSVFEVTTPRAKATGRPNALACRLSFAAATLLAVAGLAPASVASDASGAAHWVGTWSASPQAASTPVELDRQTLRQIVRVSIGGNRLRVRLSNAYGTSPLLVGAVRVGLHTKGASIAAGSDRIVTFNGSESTLIAAGALAVSDPVNLAVGDGGSLAVSIYIPGKETAATEHSLGLQTTYISPEGDYTGADALPTAKTTQSFHFLTGVEVQGRANSRAVVALGDSITDGLESTADASRRWPDRLAERLGARKGANDVAVLNAGISGNRVLRDMAATNALARLDRDVLVQSGARYLIVLEGINDIGFPGSPPVEEIIAGYRQIIDRAHAMGLKVYGGTLTPFKAFLPGIYYDSAAEAKRQAVNEWIRTCKAYDAVIDFDRVLRDPADHAALRPAYDSGDNLHPNDAGYQAMAYAVDQSLFRDATPARRAVDAKRQASLAAAQEGPLCRGAP